MSTENFTREAARDYQSAEMEMHPGRPSCVSTDVRASQWKMSSVTVCADWM